MSRLNAASSPTAAGFCQMNGPGVQSAGFRPLVAAEPGVEEAAQGVAHDVEGEHGQDDRHPGERSGPGAALDVLAALAADVAPARRGRRDAEAEERQARRRANG